MFGDLSEKRKKKNGSCGLRANGRPQTDQLIRGPMRGLKKNRMGRGQRINRQTDFVTTRPTRVGEK